MPINRRTFLSATTATVAIFALPAGAVAQSVYVANGLAIEGYDPVAYFNEAAPRRGEPHIATQWDGARWQFATTANRDLFVANPDAYAPQYGGYCAWAVSQGYTAPIDPDAWRVVDGKLYLNASRSIQRRWEADIPGFITLADAAWPGLSN
jgi:hypothetical protein